MFPGVSWAGAAQQHVVRNKEKVAVMLRLIVMGTLALTLVGCSGWSLVAYEPHSTNTTSDNLKALERLLWEQHETPNSVEVTQMFFKTSKSVVVGNSNALASQVETMIVYFDNVARIQIMQKRRLYQAMLFDKNGVLLFRYYRNDLEKVQRFTAIIAALSRSEHVGHNNAL